MLDPKTALENIYIVAKLIYDQVQLVKANQAQCQRLAERVRIIEESVQGLEKIEDKSHYQQGLNDLLKGLNESLEFIQKFTESNKWFKYILKTGTYREEFQKLNEALQKSMQQLNLGLAAQQIINHEQDKKDQAVDYAFILSSQEEIIRLNKEANAGIQKLAFLQKEGQFIILQQLASMKAQILNLQLPLKKSPIDARYTVPYFELSFDGKIGEGSFGKIYLGRWNEQTVAIKTIEELDTEEAKEQFTREVQILSHCRNKYITQFYGACLESGRACFLMEYMEKGSLYEVLEKGPLTGEQQKQMALDIAKGLHYLHTQGIIHRDLKSANVLVNAHYEVKLADFGLSKTKSASVKTTLQRSQAVQWLAPECFQRNGTYTESSDIYSYGVILWEIVTGKKPYVSLGERESLSSLPEVYAKLIKACWYKEASERPRLEFIIKTLDAYQLRPASPNPEEYYNQGLQFERLKDYTKAFEAYQRSAHKGFMKAETNLGLFYLRGTQGISVDKPKAYQSFLNAANQGHVRAMMNVATMSKHGDGVPQNLSDALYWYKKAMEAGDTKAKEEYQKLLPLVSLPVYQGFDASIKPAFAKGK